MARPAIPENDADRPRRETDRSPHFSLALSDDFGLTRGRTRCAGAVNAHLADTVQVKLNACTPCLVFSESVKVSLTEQKKGERRKAPEHGREGALSAFPCAPSERPGQRLQGRFVAVIAVVRGRLSSLIRR